MAQKSYSKHREYKEYSSKGMVPYGDEQFDMMRSDVLPSNKFSNLGKHSGDTQYHYEYKEEKIPGGKYDRKDLRTVEEYTIPSHPVGNSSSYSYYKEEGDLNDLNSTPYLDNTPGYSKVRTTTTTTKKDMHQNIEELDSLLDDLQRDQERKLYKGGYTSDTVDSSSFDYKKSSTPLKPISPPSSGYSSLRRAERTEKRWLETTDEPVTYNLAPARPPKPTEISTELYKEEKTESRAVPSQVSPAISHPVPATVCAQCHQHQGVPLNKVTTTVKTYTYEVPVGSELHTINEKLSEKMHQEHTSYHTETTTGGTAPAILPHTQPIGGCQYCSHCNSRLTTTTNTTLVDHIHPPPLTNESSRITRAAHYESSSTNLPGSGPYPGERIIYPPKDSKSPPPINGTGPYGSTVYKFSESNYSSYNNRTDGPGNKSPGEPQLSLSPGPFPRPTTPSLGVQAPPKKIDDLMADFPDAHYTAQNQDVARRRNIAQNANQRSEVDSLPSKPAPPIGTSRNVAGPAVYYPPGELFTKKEESSGAYQASGGEMRARGKYKYEAESGSKTKETTRKAVVPVCLPLCCAMPCSVM